MLSVRHELCVRIFIYSIFSPKLATLLVYLSHSISSELCKNMCRKCVLNISDKGFYIVQRKGTNNELSHQYCLTMLSFILKKQGRILKNKYMHYEGSHCICMIYTSEQKKGYTAYIYYVKLFNSKLNTFRVSYILRMLNVLRRNLFTKYLFPRKRFTVKHVG